MIPKNLDQITKTDIDSLIANQVREGRTIEYKKLLACGEGKPRKEFLADVSSFANSNGGDLIIGVEESDGVPVAADGIALASPEDNEGLRLDQIIRGGMDPCPIGVRIKFLPGFKNGVVLIIRIPQSWNGPHMVTYNDSSRFFARTGAGKHPMDTSEIRSAFGLTAELPEQIRRFRDERIARYLSGESPVGQGNRPTMMLHLIPVSSFATGTAIDVEKANNDATNFPPLRGMDHQPRYNADGLLRCTVIVNDLVGYCQVFRSGRIESVNSEWARERDGKLCVPIVSSEADMFESLSRYQSGLKTLELSPPYVVLVTLINVKGVFLASERLFYHNTGRGIDREIVYLPDVMISDDGKPLEITLRPVLDAIWNAGGYSRCFNYDESGKWVRGR